MKSMVGCALLFGLACWLVGCGCDSSSPGEPSTPTPSSGQTASAGSSPKTPPARGTAPSGRDPSGSDPSGSDPSGRDPSGSDPSGASDPDGRDPGSGDATAGPGREAGAQAAWATTRSALEEPQLAPEGPRALGPVPASLDIHWPKPPRVEDEVEVRSTREFNAAARRSRVRIRVRGNLEDPVTVQGSDLEIVADDGVRVKRLTIGRGQKRLVVRGGEWGWIELQVPAQFYPQPPVYKREWLVEDLLVQDVRVRAEDTAFLLRGKRIAIVNSDVEATRYCVWAGDTVEFPSEDIILAGNRFRSAGPEATVRLVDVLRTVTVDNVMRNEMKHNYRVHGVSDLTFAARNKLIGTGVMIGTQPPDDVERSWFIDNVMWTWSPGVMNVDKRHVARMFAKKNVVYTNSWDEFYIAEPLASWEFDDNVRHPFQDPPAELSQPRPKSD